MLKDRLEINKQILKQIQEYQEKNAPKWAVLHESLRPHFEEIEWELVAEDMGTLINFYYATRPESIDNFDSFFSFFNDRWSNLPDTAFAYQLEEAENSRAYQHQAARVLRHMIEFRHYLEHSLQNSKTDSYFDRVQQLFSEAQEVLKTEAE